MTEATEVSEAQVLHFRAHRGHVAGPGAKNVVQAARALIGAQSQQLGPGLLALSQRTKGRPKVATVERQVLGEAPKLVRTWGQRETIHIYDPEDWHLIAAARQLWAPAGRRGPMPSDELLDEALSLLRREGPLTRKAFHDLAPASYLRALQAFQPKYIPTRDAAKKFAAGRLFWKLSMNGDACVVHKIGAAQAYAARTQRFPDLAWPEIAPEEAAKALTRRYLAVNGPATVKDVAHHFGSRQREAKVWLESLQDELTPIRCGDRKGLVLLTCDLATLCRKPKPWPLRLLPMWDTYLMGHADKSWTTPVASEQKRVWRSSAVVAAGIFVGGRIVGEWKHDVRARELDVHVEPLSAWRKKHLAGVKREAKLIAAHYGLSKSSVSVT